MNNKNSIPAGLVITAIAVLAILVAITSYVSAKNAGVRHETGIEAAYDDGKNVYAQYGQEVGEAAQIPAMQTDDLTKVVTAALQARYGNDGSKAMFQFIKEQNPTLNQETYLRIQDIISSGRRDFKKTQTVLIDKRRSYKLALGSFWSGIWLGIAGFPNIRLETEFLPISTSAADAVYETGRETSPIKIR